MSHSRLLRLNLESRKLECFGNVEYDARVCGYIALIIEGCVRSGRGGKLFMSSHRVLGMFCTPWLSEQPPALLQTYLCRAAHLRQEGESFQQGKLASIHLSTRIPEPWI